MKPQLSHVLQVWNTEDFSTVLKYELEVLASGSLPLHEATTHGGLVDDNDISVSILNMRDNAEKIIVEAGVFFTEVVGGCSCGDDPMSENAYCRTRITIDKHTAETDFSILPE